MTIHHIPAAPLPYIVRDALDAVVFRAASEELALVWVREFG